jgi:hypothetical protein
MLYTRFPQNREYFLDCRSLKTVSLFAKCNSKCESIHCFWNLLTQLLKRGAKHGNKTLADTKELADFNVGGNDYRFCHMDGATQ